MPAAVTHWHRQTILAAGSLLAGLAFVTPLLAAGEPTAAQALTLAPVQKQIDYDRPTEAEVAKCSLKPEKSGKSTGWTVLGPAGQTLRRFMDTNGDGALDLWCYYKDGIEVYRDIDSDFNRQADQYRWLHTAGTRWGIDRNEDGIVDVWQAISAEEVTQEAVAAIGNRDAQRFNRLLATSAELETLGLGEDKQKEIATRIKAATAEFDQLAAKQRVVTEKSHWANFGGSKPGLVPAGLDGSRKDVLVYENVVTMVEAGGKHEQVCIGTLVQVGNVWRLVDAPQVLAAKDVARTGVFFRAPTTATPQGADAASAAIDEEVRKTLADIEKIERGLASATDAAQTSKLHARRTELLLSLIQKAKSDADRAAWIRQLADSVSVAVQSGTYPEGLDRLKELLAWVNEKSLAKNVVSYVAFRNILADYGVSLQDDNANYAKIQETYVANLKKFVADYPQAPDAADAMLQLATAEEFSGKEDEAKQWYGKLITLFPQAPVAKKATGAQRRLAIVGKAMTLKGRTIDGKNLDLSAFAGRVVLVHYWASWSEPCKSDLAQLKQLYTKFAPQGLSIVSVSCDYTPQTLAAFLKQNPLAWPQVYETGALDNRLATEMGIVTLPTIVLVDRQGNVVNRNIHVSDLEKALTQQFTARTAQPKTQRRQ